MEQLGKDKKEMTEMMWKEGDSILADRKDMGASLMGRSFVPGIELILRNYVDKYVTWMEREVSKKDTSVGGNTSAVMHEQTGKEAGPGTVSYGKRCIQTLGTEPKEHELAEAKEEMEKKLDWRKANWKDEQFTPLTDDFVISLENKESPQKTPVKPKTGRLEEQESVKRKRNETAGLTTPLCSFPSIRRSKKTAQKKIPNAQGKDTAVKKAPSTRGKETALKKTPDTLGEAKKARTQDLA
jgi:hypothetical protein